MKHWGAAQQVDAADEARPGRGLAAILCSTDLGRGERETRAALCDRHSRRAGGGMRCEICSRWSERTPAAPTPPLRRVGRSVVRSRRRGDMRCAWLSAPHPRPLATPCRSGWVSREAPRSSASPRLSAGSPRSGSVATEGCAGKNGARVGGYAAVFESRASPSRLVERRVGSCANGQPYYPSASLVVVCRKSNSREARLGSRGAVEQEDEADME